MAPNNDEKDSELLTIFIEEALDLNQSISLNLLHWKEDFTHTSFLTQIKRDLHTLKGGARMVEQNAIATLSHELESYCDFFIAQQKPISLEQYGLISRIFDHLSLMIESLKTKEEIPYPTSDNEALKKSLYIQEPSEPSFNVAKTEALTLPTTKEPIESNAVKKTERKAEISTLDEVIRVRAALLDNLNTLSLEESMSRIGMEQQLRMIGALINEMKVGDTRLIEQIDVLEKELSNIIKTGKVDLKGKLHPSEGELESEKYTALDRMISGLREIVTDSGNLLKGVNDIRLNMENLLASQSRSNTELQNKLTDTRLVSFETVVPRLTKIVRQISSELNKKIDFSISKVEGEMDRTTLEHLIPSFEHILRNAIDHGIESEEERKESQKPPMGKIEIGFYRSGSTVSIEITDDGRGIDVESIRKKAISMNMLDPNQQVSETELVHFILKPGFSTRESVSEISGRGVGLDVVNAAIKEMGGLISISSKKGLGTKFTLSFPFTTSLNRVLVFKVGEQVFGILLSFIEGVERVDLKTLQEFMQKKTPVFVSAHKPYYLHYLQFLIELDVSQLILEKRKDFPVILIPSNEYPMALVVDELLYSKELIIQSLGAQFKFLDECSGATLLGNGKVVLILDPVSLMNKARGTMTQEKKSIEFSEKRKIKSGADIVILVVDDSLTIRAVTKRFLERHKFEVMTAQDGLDALQQMEKQIPDLILLDIDMPRMDGFEFSIAARKDERFKHIPIIVITSRPSEKHKKQAKMLDLEGFIEKPFQEASLLEAIDELLGDRD